MHPFRHGTCLLMLIFKSKRNGRSIACSGTLNNKVHLPQTSSNKGFATIGILILLSVLILLSILSFRFVGWILVERETQMACQSELATGQKKVAQMIENLLDLNTKIRAAKVFRATGYAAIASGIATSNPILIAEGNKIVELATKTLQSLSLLQKTLILQAQLKMNQTLISAKKEIEKTYKAQIKNQQLALQNIQGSVDFLVFKKLAVRPTDSTAEYPEYELIQPFSALQSLSVFWTMTFTTTKENSVWTKIGWKNTQSCSVTIRETNIGQNKLQVRLNLGKPLSSF